MGWVSTTTAPCVALSISAAMQGLIDRGSAQFLLDKWQPLQACPKTKLSKRALQLGVQDLAGLIVFNLFFIFILAGVRLLCKRKVVTAELKVIKHNIEEELQTTSFSTLSKRP